MAETLHTPTKEELDAAEAAAEAQPNPDTAVEEAVDITPEMQKRIDELRAAKEKSANTDSLLAWLTNETPDFSSTLMEVRDFLAPKEGETPTSENEAELKLLEQIIELRETLPKVLEQFNAEVAKLAGLEFSQLKDRKEMVIKALADPVVNGHIKTDELMSAIGGGVQLMSREEIMKQPGLTNYEAAMAINLETKTILISEESMKDDYTPLEGDKIPGGIDLRHSINHEISHKIVDRLLEKNPVLTKQAETIIENASGLKKEYQTIHIRNVLDSLSDLDSSFEKDWDKNHKDDKEPVSDEIKAAAKQKFIIDEKKKAATEIITDYTALYMQSDGSLAGFFEKCYDQISDQGKNSFNLRIKTINEFYKATGEEKEQKLAEMKAADPELAELANIYLTFHSEIKKALANRGNLLRQEGEEDEEFAGLYSGGYIPESAGACAQNQGQKGDGDLKAAAFGFFAAFAEEVHLKAPGLET